MTLYQDKKIEISDLLTEIEQECHFTISKSTGLLELFFKACEEVLQVSENENTEEIDDIFNAPQDKKDVFYISRSEQTLEVKTKEEFETYKNQILDLDSLKWLVKHWKDVDEEWLTSVIKLIKKLIEDVEKKCRLVYEKEADNTERLAEYVHKQILEKHIKKIMTPLFRQIHRNKSDNSNVMFIINALNEYLHRLGVCTVIAQVGGHYKKVEECYELIFDNSHGPNPDPMIEEVEYPAYLIEYIDEDGRLWYYCAEGRCTGK